jgi:hypothetical protein
VYTLSLILLEWLSLEHPRRDKKTLSELLAATISDDIPPQFVNRALMSGVYPGYLVAIAKGLKRDRNERLASVEHLERELSDAICGRVPIVCHVTLARRGAYEIVTWIERHPGAYSLMFGAVVLAVIATIVWGVYGLVR